MSAVQVHRPLALTDSTTRQVDLSGQAVEGPDIQEGTETKEYRILLASRYYVKLTEETWEKLLEAKKQESAAEHQKRIKNWVQSHARVSGKDEVPAGTYDRDCQALYERISGVA